MKSSLFCVLMLSLAPLLAPPLTGQSSAGSIEKPEMKIEKGDRGIVTEDYEGCTVYVWNPTPIENRDQTLRYGDPCVIKERNFVSVIGFDGDWVLVRYSVGSVEKNYPCPSGTIFYISKESFLEMRTAREEKDKVRQLLREEKK